MIKSSITVFAVLLVEDNTILRKAYKMALEQFGYVVEAVGTGMEALKLGGLSTYSLILMDIGLPDKSGIEVAKAFRQSSAYKNTPIIAIIAYVDEEIRNTCITAGFDLVLDKAITLEELTSHVRAFDRE